MAVSLVARKKFGPYLGQSYLPGQTFEARDESDAHVLTLAGVAARVESLPAHEPVVAPEPEPAPAVVDEPAPLTSSPDDDAEPEVGPEPDAPKAEPVKASAPARGRYRRRDMQADK